MTTKLTLNNLTSETLAAITGPRISNVQIVDSQYNALDDTAANVGGGYIIINGQSFNSAAQVLIDQTPATTITWVSNTQIRAEIPASTEGASKSVYVINPDGSLALLVNGLTYSAFPAWSTGSTLTSSEALVPISIQLSAPAANNYTLAASNTLPSAVTLYANGLIAGTVAANTTTNYNFTVIAKDSENQDTSRSFTLPITQNVEPAWVTSNNLGTAFTETNYSNTLVATDLSSITYSVAVGSSLPANLTLAANGLLSGSVSAANTYSFAIVATDTANLSNTRTFSISIITPDPYSLYNTLLLNGEGAASTNGANNSVFIDSSTNNFNIDRFGNANQGTFSPYGDRWSNYFDGTGDYLTAPDNAVFEMTGDFTVEAWFYCTALPGSGAFGDIITKGAAGVYQPYYIFIRDSGALVFYSSSNGSSWDVASNVSFGTIAINTWYHVAVSRSGSSLRMFLNGALINTITNSNALTNNDRAVAIGARSDGTEVFTGYISNVRIVKGTAVYTSAFTPPTSPLTAITNTSLLICQSNRFIDNSTNNFTLTRAGDVSVQAFAPFIQTVTRYTPSLYGGSAYFDGTGDKLSIPSPTTGFSFGTGEFTIEMWVYKTVASNDTLLDARSSATATPWALAIDGSNFPYFYDGTSYTSSVAVTLNSWSHVSVVRTSGVLKIFVNGVQGYSASYATNLDRTAGLLIGDTVHAAAPLLAYISNLRIVKGTAVYTSAFTPPTSPLTAIANTSLLTNFTNAGIIDQTGQNNLETVGNAQLSTAVKKYNSASMYFDGTGDYLTTPAKNSLSFGTGDFTVEAWVYFASIAADRAILGSSGVGGYDFVWRTSNGLNIGRINTAFDNSFAFTPVVNTWYHIAYSRSGTSLRAFVDGTQVGTTATNSIAYNSVTAVIVGGSTTADRLMNGYIDDLRITKGYARYTSNFTPPDAID